MIESTFVRVWQPADVTQAAEARIALEGTGIPFFIQNEQYMHATGLPFSLGVAQIWVLVPEEHAGEASEILDDWFRRDPAVRAVAAPFLFLLGLVGLTELAIALGRRLSNRQSAEEAAPE
jgi:hypothetical protein